MGEGGNGSGAGSKPRGRGRPVGSDKLTPEVRRIILAYVEAGAFDYVAAEAAGVDERTFRDWLRRGRGRHPSRASTPELASFAREVEQARGRARASREIEVATSEPKFWLTHSARSKPGREGWTDPVQEPTGPPAPSAAYVPTAEETQEIVRALVEAGAVSLRCEDPGCPCRYHRQGEP